MPRRPIDVKGRSDNFRILNPDRAATKRMVEVMEAMLNPVPWQAADDGLVLEPTPLTELANRIYARADRGHVVRLRPETAKRVAQGLWLVSEGPMIEWNLQHEFGHRVEDWTHERISTLAYCQSANLSVGAWLSYAPKYPSREIVVRWGPFTLKRSSRDLKRG